MPSILFRSKCIKNQHIYESSDFYTRDYLDEDDPLIERLIEARLALLANGWPCIPVGGKRRLAAGWTSGEITVERVKAETREHTAKLNTGIRTGYLVGA